MTTSDQEHEFALAVDPGLHMTAWAIVSCRTRYLGFLRDGPCQFSNGELQVHKVGLWKPARKVVNAPEQAVIAMCQSIRLHEQPWCGMMFNRFIIESQQVYDPRKVNPMTGETKSKGDPADLIRLATISGAVLHAYIYAGEHFSTTQMIRNPVPFEWKGNIEKITPQARACLRLGWDFKTMGGKDVEKQFAVPINSPFPGYTGEEWKNIMDAVAMGIWGLKQ